MEKELKVPVAILDACCELCAHSCPRKPQQTILERWEEDTRPVRPTGLLGFLKGFFRGSEYWHSYKDEHPYKHSGLFGAKWKDDIELTARKEDVTCSLMPKHRTVYRKHYCGQFKPKTVIGDERI